MKYIRLMGTRYRLTITILLAALLGGGNTQAQVVVHGNVYGGGNAADVGANATVNISAGKIGDDTQIDDDHGNVFGGGKGLITTVVGDVEVNIGKKVTIENEQSTVTYSNNDKVIIKGSVYGGSALGAVNATKANDWDEDNLDRISATNGKATEVNICAGTVNGNIYGGGRGDLAAFGTGHSDIEAKSFGAVSVSIGVATSSDATTAPIIEGSIYGGSNLNGFLESSALVDVVSGTIGKITTTEGENPTTTITGGYVHGGGYGQSTLVKGDVTVNIGAISGTSPNFSYYGYATIYSDVYGGSAKGNVNATKNGSGILVVSTYTDPNDNTKTLERETNVNLYGGTISGDLYGGGLGQLEDNTTNPVTPAIAANVFGPVTVTTKGGTATNVYGCNNLYGSPQQNVFVNIDGGTITNDVYGGGHEADALGGITVNVTGGIITNDVYGGGALASTNTDTPHSATTVNLTGGTVRNVYGGGLGNSNIAAFVYGVVQVNIGESSQVGHNDQGPSISGDVFGCNNINGSPQDNVFVDVYHTKHNDNNIFPRENDVITVNLDNLDVDNPDASEYTQLFALNAVYGGGNKAAYTAVDKTATVTIHECYDNTVRTVYGGGNAADATNVQVIIDGGRFDRVFGGGNGYSSTNNHDHPDEDNYNPGANVSGTATTLIYGGIFRQIFGGSNQYGDIGSASLTIEQNCDLLLNESFGGANEAVITGDIVTTLSCGDNISVGNFYGGSNKANITGNVVLNVEGGTYVNVFGGSKGTVNTPANIEGDVTLNLYGGTMINAFGGSDVNGNITGKITVNVLDKESNTCPLFVTNIYGAGNLTAYTPDSVNSQVISSPEVNVLHIKSGNSITGNVYGGGKGDATHNAMVTANPVVNIGYDATTMSSLIPSGYIGEQGVLSSVDNLLATVTGNVYGGGDLAQITGSTTINLRKANSSVANIFGGGNLANVSGSTTVNINDGTVNQDVYGGGALANVGTSSSDATIVTVTGGTVTGSVYGGGLGRIAVDEIPGVAAAVNGAVTVNINGGTITDVFGCNNNNGAPHSTVTVNIEQTTASMSVTNVFGGGNLAAYSGSPIVNINNGTVSGNVYGGGNGDTSDNTQTKGSTAAPTVTVGDTLTGHETYVAIVRGDVYGGGNAAKVTGSTAPTVLVQKCNTEVGYVYGGGNAADVPATNVTITGGTISHDVYGGGHGDKASLNVNENDHSHSDKAANVTGNVSVSVTGGTIDKVFAGSNLNGNISGTVALEINKDADGACEMKIGEVYGGGNQAAGNAGTITIGCTGTWTEDDDDTDNNDNFHNKHNSTDNRIGYELEGIGTVYGGANAANVGTSESPSNITLNITGGIVDTIFGGNNASGNINGDITVNVEWGSASCDNYLGNVYGGGNLASYSQNTAGHPAVNIKNGTVSGNVYGGGKGDPSDATKGVVTGNPIVIIGDLTEGHEAYEAIVSGEVYGGGDAAVVTGNSSVTLQKSNSSVNKLFGGGNAAGVSGTSSVTLAEGAVTAGVYGGCNASGSVGTVAIALNGGTVGATGSGNEADVYGGGFGASTTTTGDIGITLNGTTVYGDIYGGSAFGQVNASTSNTTTITISSNTLNGSIYGGGKGDVAGEEGHSDVTATSNGNVVINYNTANTNLSGLYGGVNVNGLVSGNIEVNVKANVGAAANRIDIFGGGLGAATNTGGNVTVNVGDNTNNSQPVIYGDVYGGSEFGSVNDAVTDSTTVNILSGTLHGNTYGGGLGEAGVANVAKGQVNGAVTVNIGATDGAATPTYTGFATIDGDVYGCNNTNGSPKGDVTVNIYKTAHTTTDVAGYTENDGTNGNPTYAIANVFGGGRQADYSPVLDTDDGTTSSKRATVHVHGCDNTIEDLFGGGDAAAAYGVVTIVDGGRYNRVFGGGNGEVSAANIGVGGTNLQVHGGKISLLFGGSNTSGTITGDMGISVDNTGPCSQDPDNMYVAEFFCGNNKANIGTSEHPVNINATIGCGTKFGDVYGGCNLADIYGNVTLTIQGGEMNNVYGGSKGQIGNTPADSADITGNVMLNIYGGIIRNNAFGGSNINGNITGSITVNMDWSQASSGCNSASDLYVGNVYGASNLATYTPTTPGNYPEVNIKHGTVTHSVFGGGKGLTATVTSNPVVTIGDNVSEHTAVVTENVYGGGDLAVVTGSTSVTLQNSNSSIGGNLFGGGNQANVTGSVTVALNGGTVTNDVYGGGALAETNTSYTSGNTPATSVTLAGATVTGSVYGGGLGQAAAAAVGTEGEEGYVPAKSAVAANVNGPVTVTVTSGSAANVYGCNNVNGSPERAVAVNIAGGNVGNVYGGGNLAAYTGNSGTAVSVSSGTVGYVYGGGLGTTAVVNGNTSVTISGGTVNYDVYGGGSLADVTGNVSVIMNGGSVLNDVYGGGALANTNTGNWNDQSELDDNQKTKTYYIVSGLAPGVSDVTGYYTLPITYTQASGTAQSGVTYYRKQYTEISQGDIIVGTTNVSGYYIETSNGVYEPATGTALSLYGYYQLLYIPVSADNITVGTTDVSSYFTREVGSYTDASGLAQENTMYYRLVTGDWASNMNNPSTGTTYITSVNLTGGIIGHLANNTSDDYLGGNVYGGGLGRLASNTETAVEAMVYGDIEIQVDGTAFIQRHKSPGENLNDVPFSGRVFGCNNLNGTPKGNVTVTVNRTIPVVGGVSSTNHDENRFEIHSIYGGGNLASYMPAEGKKTKVIIDGCEETYIEKVFGGGNSASVPETDVVILGSGYIGYAFGGGNGADKIWNGSTWNDNKGAPIYGNASIIAVGGKIGQVFSGSDTKGTVYGSATVKLADENNNFGYTSTCPLRITNTYGAGRGADINGDVNLIVSACSTGDAIERVFGGSYDANIRGDVNLTITSGIFSSVFGGNDHGGSIGGNINVNIEETDGCNPIIIQYLYGGGREAVYPGPRAKNKNGESVSSGKITVNVKSATRIDNVYGGSYRAQVNGDTEVNINMIKGSWVNRPVSFPESYRGDSIPNLKDKTANYVEVTGLAYQDQNVDDSGSLVNGYYTKETVEGQDIYTKIDNQDARAQSGTDYYRLYMTGNVIDDIGTIGNVFGGSYESLLNGNATINIGTATKVDIMKRATVAGTDPISGTALKVGDILATDEGNIYDTDGKMRDNIVIDTVQVTVLGAHITGNVYGGGNLADVGITYNNNDIVVDNNTGHTTVNICAKDNSSVTPGTSGVSIAGNVFGGGKGLAAVNAFKCDQGMVKETDVSIGNGTVHGSVYGGGEVGRVEQNTAVTIGYGNGSEGATKAPVIDGNVFGAGAGVNTHGYSALVRGKSEVTVQGNTWVKGSVYGGGEVASVGKYQVDSNGMPVALYNPDSPTSGYCYVTIKGYAEIGPDDMVMNNTTTGKPDDAGHVFGAGKGVLPYNDIYRNPLVGDPWRVTPNNNQEFYNDTVKYLKYIETLALATQTDVTIGGNAFVKGSVYGGSENGIVQHNTKVTIQDNCQIGNGYVQMDNNGNYLNTKRGVNRRYTNAEWTAGRLFAANDPDYEMGTDTELENLVSSTNYNNSLPECASWQYGQNVGSQIIYEPYDNFANASGFYDNSNTESADGGRPTGSDGHTFFGNVFGGGSGYYPYVPGKWHEAAGAVYGNTEVIVTGGHILTNIYGGNEMTNVGKGVTDTNGGKCTITMSSGTLGVPRTLKQILAHPVTCYLFGGGKGDQRVLFNKLTNVNDVDITITGGIIYGSVFGGGEDGHVMRDVTMIIGNSDGTGPTIGTLGTSYVDGNVFGGGRGFGGDAYTAGNVGGSVDLKIKGGTMLGSIYGGGRLGSVGYGLYSADEEYDVHGDELYGAMRPDDELDNGNDAGSVFTNGRGHIEIEISGGTIGNNNEYIVPTLTGTQLNNAKANIPNTILDNNNHLIHTKGGNVFAGGMGRREMLDGETEITGIDWRKLGNVKSTKLTITGGTIKSNVYGGGEFGAVKGFHTTGGKQLGTEIIITGGTIGTTIGSGNDQYHFGSVFGGGMGHNLYPSGNVDVNTSVEISGGTVRKNVYGGGEVGSVGTITNFENRDDTDASGYIYRHDFQEKVGDGALYSFGLSWPYEFIYDNTTGLASVTIQDTAKVLGDVYGASKGEVNVNESDITKQRFKEAIIANVRETNVTINLDYSPTADPDLTKKCIGGSVYGGGEDGHVYDSTTVIIEKGLIGGSVFGGGKGEGTYSTTLWDKDNAKQNKQINGEDVIEPIYSWTAGKIYGNATVIMNGGWIMQNVYGGGYFGSVGKGNYAGGQDDYYPNGYGELPLDDNANLWTTTDGFNPKAAITSENKPISFADHFMSSGVATVTIKGGTIGTADGAESDGFPYGNVFGSSRGKAAIAISGTLSPRYRYIPNFYLGYANETKVTIGDDSGDGPRIYGSVYGGGQDGHVRRDAKVTINNGVIGLEYNQANRTLLENNDIKSTPWMTRGNVYGAGSGLGKYSSDATAYNYSSGSVTCVAEVEINGGTIYQNVYGGGALASIGPPNTSVFIKPQSPDDDESDQSSDNRKSKSYTKVSINGGSIGNESGYIAGYGGNVFAASRGNETLGLDSTQFATDLWSKLDITGGTIYGNVYGGGEFGRVKQGVTVNILGGEIKHDVYGGGALASTNTSAYAATPAGRSTVLNVKGGTMNNIYGGGLGRLKFTNHIPKSDIYPTSGNVLINLNEDVASGDKGAIVNQIFGANNYNGSPQGDVTIHVYATQNKDASKANISSKFVKENTDVTVLTIASNAEVAEFITKLKGYLLDDIKLATALGGISLTEYQSIYDSSSDTAAIKTAITELTTAINNKIETAADPDAEKAKADAVRYDVQAIYGGGNLAAYEPAPDNNSETTTKSTEVIIDGCDYTSIRQVYGSGNAASSPATHVIVNASYEIDEVFGGGNGADAFELVDGNDTIKYINPGANIGYKNYTHFEKVSNNYFDAIVNNDAQTKEGRNAYAYGSGIATTDIRGGTIHTVYGGSNKKGNIRTTAMSVYEDADDTCPVQVDETYGGGKDAPMDGNIDLSLDCVKDMPRIFGGAKNADVNANIVLNITNGDFEQVFGGNNTSGNVYGSITVNVEEKGCQPITIGELYAGGYLAPYSIYGYYQENGKWKPRTKEQWNNLDNTEKASAGVSTAFANPRVNIISAQRIDTIFGGGYHADMVASPYINVNMQKGKFYIFKKETNGQVTYEDVNHKPIPGPDTIEYKDNIPYRYYSYIPIGTIGTIYGGGLEAVIDGNTHIDIGTGEWRNIEWKREMDGTIKINNEDVTKTFTFDDTENKWSYISGYNNDVPVISYLDEDEAPTPVRKAATITGNVFGGGSNADVTGNTNINIANGHIYFNVYGGGRMGSVGTIERYTIHDDVETGFALSWPYEFTYKTGTGTTNINITGGRFGFAGKDVFELKDGYYQYLSSDKNVEDVANGKPRLDNGDIFGGGKGQAGDRYDMAFVANVNNTVVNINYPTTPANTTDATSYDANGTNVDCITGSVYGGSEDGHVYGNTNVTINGGMIGHAVYGGGKGKGTYEVMLHKRTTSSTLPADSTATVYSITAGKVYGNTNITMNDGYVVRNIFGGGNLGSVGKGNYAGGTDDYTVYAPNQVKPTSGIHVGYGECLQGDLWTANGAFMSSGIATVTVTGGTVGTPSGTKDDLPTGNIFGGCRGTAVPNVPYTLQPRYLYCPEFFLGYVNEGIVNIGSSSNINGTGPRIYGSVYGGGQDGHVRRETNVTVYGGEIGNAYTTQNRQEVGTLTLSNPNEPTDADKVLIADHSDLTNMQWLHRGNVLGAGSGIGKYDADKDPNGEVDTHCTASGSVTHRTIVNIKGGTIYHNVYGGGSLASVGPPKMGQQVDIDAPVSSANNGNGYTDISTKLSNGKSSISIVNIEGKVGDETSYSNGYGGNIFGSSRGANATETLALETGKTYASDFYSQVNIKAGANVLGDVFGGGEAGLVFNNASVIVSGLMIDNDASKVSKIGHDVFGGGDKADVMGNTNVTITGGHILHNVYGGGRMGSVGTVTDKILHNKGMASDYSLYEFGLSWPVEFQYAENTGKATVSISGNTRLGTNGDDNGDVFGGGMGDITVNWTELIRSDDRWSTMGSTDDERIINYLKSYRSFDEAEIANVKETDVTINLPFTGTLDSHITPLEVKDNDGENKYKLIIDASYDPSTDTYTITRGIPCITGSVYGGSENGHVNGDTRLELVDGIVGHALYGGGKGKGTYQGRLYDINNPAAPMTVKNYTTLNTMISEKNASLATDKQHDLYGTEYGVLGEQIYSITAGKVYGNTYVTMDNGYVLRNIFGGGNLGSVGKGNYAGGADDYSTDGYGERPDTDNGIHANLWTSSYDPEAALSESNKPDFAWHFINSGQTNIDIKGGQIGYILPGLSSLNIDDSSDAQSTASKLAKKDDLPTGNVFGGSRGQASPSGRVSPRYMYIPDYFLGYVNQTNVIIGTTSDTAGSGPKILGSVYGGGQDGHVRRDAHVTVNNASIGVAFSESANTTILGTNKENLQWRGRGNVFGAGSGIGTYTAWEKDKNGNYNYVDDGLNFASGSVTNNTIVTINKNAVIYQNVYGGGSLASIGPPDMGLGYEQKIPETTFAGSKSSSSNNVIINGGTIGHADSYKLGYGGNVFGASRGNISNLNLGATPFLFATSIWTNVEAKSGHIFGNVFGGGENGAVNKDTYVEIGGVPVGQTPSSPAPGRSNTQQTEPAQQSQAQPQGNAQSRNSANGATQGNAATESQQTRTINTNRAQ